jgi:lipoprotein LpqH
MKRVLGFALAGAVCVGAVLASCSSHKSSSSGSSSAKPMPGGSSVSSVAALAPGQARVIIDGQDETPNGSVMCRATGGLGTVEIFVPGSGDSVVLTDAPRPEVQRVTLVSSKAGNLFYQPATNVGSPLAVKDGNSYTVTGHVFPTNNNGVMDNGAMKLFEFDVTCPQ